MNWNDERVELLRKLWSEGLSASQIAAQLGGVSRNAVIGKVHRLKLSSRGRTQATPAKPVKAAPQRAPQAPATISKSVTSPRGGVSITTTVAASTTTMRPMPASVGATALQAEFDNAPVVRQITRPTEDVVVPISRRLKLTELSERTCKWPVGDPLSDDFHFCGNEAGDTGPYCKYHARIAFQPASDRRRIR